MATTNDVKSLVQKDYVRLRTHMKTPSCYPCNKDGIHQSKYLHSFPQRFEKAFGIERDVFADVLLGKQTWPITEDDCIRVQEIADAAQESCRTGQLVHL